LWRNLRAVEPGSSGILIGRQCRQSYGIEVKLYVVCACKTGCNLPFEHWLFWLLQPSLYAICGPSLYTFAH
ncbi:hypothetical protein ACH5RR_036895, partial [Cinchona calisaya]